MKRTTTILFFLVPIITFSQTIFKGTVADEFGPLDGANITIKNTRIGTVSDSNGNYEIETKKTDTLLITYLGYDTDSVIVSDKKSNSIVLSGNVLLDEVNLVAYSSHYCRTLCCGVHGVVVKSCNLNSSIITEKLYPNPSKNGIFQLNLLNDYNKVKVHVSNISGKLIKIEERQMALKNIEIDLSNYPAGIYIINIIADGKRLSPKKAIRG
ncbi:carboxypeptidase-like regulatory domain-containing protein [Algibacter sp. R77976]|uniref:carboxypeptidase-like regulatory domain-containing protein n=1 Tax=Algibacter sp. R77976 TaxID=3093873 RepID=UPI0037CC2D48